MSAARSPDSAASGMPPHQDASPVAAWTIDGLVARQAIDASSARRGTPAASIRLDHPASGIGFDEPRAEGWPTCLLGLVLDPAAGRATGGHVDVIAPTDLWVRGGDVVAVYEPRDPRSLRATAMWRRWPNASPDVAAWELVASCQTSLLESDATVLVRTIVSPGHIVSAAAAGSAIARTVSGPTVFVAAHPLEARRLTIGPLSDADSTGLAPAAIDCWLFPSVVEKGVLLRGRVLAAVGPRGNDDSWSASLLDRFAASPTPLTT